MLVKALATACALALFAGCAAPPAEPRLAADHPANPDAPAAPAPPVSTTLAIEPASAAPAVNAPAPPHDHSAMQHNHDGPAAAAAVYVCPHHPEVISDKPDQRCPKCGMKLVKKEQPPANGAGHEGHEAHHD